MSHYEFQKWVALGWIYPEKFGDKSMNFMIRLRKSYLPPGQATAVVEKCEKNSENCVRCNRVNNASLDPTSGKLRCRLVFGGTEQL